jgi:hypothetical protein
MESEGRYWWGKMVQMDKANVLEGQSVECLGLIRSSVE